VAGAALLGAGALLAFVLTRPAATTVPHLVGLHKTTIARVTSRDHLDAAFHTEFGSAPRGTAFSQHPGSGTRVSQGTRVSVLISAGPRPVAVPGLVGDGASQAAAALQAVGLLRNVTTVPAPGVAPGTVVAQQPSAPATAVPGSTVAVQEAEVPSWHAVTSVSGSSDGQSVPFRIRGDRWRVKYNMSYQGTCTFILICFGPHVTEQDLSTGTTIKSADMSTGNNTQTFQTGPGTYQLQVGAGEDSADWSATVEDLY